MKTDSVIRARIDSHSKEQAAAILEAIGLSMSDAIRIMVRRIVHDKRLPFEPLIPNQETLEAIAAADRGEVDSFNTIEELMADLNEDD
jgi:DNA-damage-inducible protein J